MPTKKKRGSLFSQELRLLVNTLLDRDGHTSSAAIAGDLGIDKPRLSRLLGGKDIAGSRTVARVCASLSRANAGKMLRAYLRDEAETVLALAGRKARSKWGANPLVVVRTV